MPFSWAYNTKFGYRPLYQTNVGIADGCSNVGGSGATAVWPDMWSLLSTNGGTIDLKAPGGSDGSLSIVAQGVVDVSSGQDMSTSVDKVCTVREDLGLMLDIYCICYNLLCSLV